MISPEDRAARRRRRSRALYLRWGLLGAAALLVFAVGVALGEALHDNPRPQPQITYFRTVQP